MLKFFSGLILLLITVQPVLAAQWAIVKKEKAIIYADLRKTTPLGFVRQGKRVRVGEVGRSKGTLLPIIVSGRVGYIKITDLYLSREMDEIENANKDRNYSRFKMEEIHNKETKPQTIRAGFKFFSAGTDWSDINSAISIAQGINATSSSFGSEFNFYYERSITPRFVLGAGGKRVSLSGSHLDYSGMFLSFLAGWQIMKASKHHIHLEGMYHHALSASISSPFGNTALSGSGYELAAKWTYDVSRSFGLVSSLSYMMLTHTVDTSTVLTTSNFNTGGLAVNFGLAWYF